MAISPDGRKLVYLGAGEGGSRLWLRDLDKLRPAPIPGTDGAVSPFFAPDGRHLGFIRNGRTVRVLSLDGGPPLTLTDSANTTSGAWGEDGYVYFEVDSGIARVPATGGPVEPLYKFSSERREIGTEFPAVLPGGKGLIFRVRRRGQPPTEFDIFGMKLPKGEARPLIRGIYARYAASGHLLVVTADGKLLAAPFDPDKLALTGPAVAILEGLRSGPFEENMAVAGNGSFVYATGGSSSSTRALWVDREGKATPVDPAWDPQGAIDAVAVSADGKTLAVGLNRIGSQDVWVKQLPAGPFSRITFGDTPHFRPSWSADGRSLVYLADAGTGAGVPMMSRADGTGPPQAMLASSVQFRSGDAIPRRPVAGAPPRAATRREAATSTRMKSGDTTTVPLLNSQAQESAPALSPDGRWLAYSSDESGSPEVYVRPFPDVASGRWQVSLTGGTAPKWARSGRELFYLNGRQEMVGTTVRAGATFEAGQPKVLFSASSYILNPSYPIYDVAADDRGFVMVRSSAATEATEVILTQNWFEELKARAPR